MSEETAVVVEPKAKLTTEEKDVQASAAVRRYMYGTAALTLVPVPAFDVVAIVGLQIKLVHSLSQVYEVPFKQEWVRASVISLIGGLGSTALAVGVFRSMVKVIPLVGPALSQLVLPATAGAVTYAVGKIYQQHFAAGGTLLSFDPVKLRAHFRKLYEEGLKVAKNEAGFVPAAEAATK